ncbi:MAG TPA: hypothetical protein VFT64_02375 [Rickettsiales bacterium]|nr:hypothetical protein [Rickettsiales bacterium]
MNAIGRKEYAEVLLKQKELERAAAQAERAAGQEQGTSTGMVSPEKLSKVVSEMRSSTTGDEPAAKVEVQNVDKVQVPTPMPKPPSVGGGSPRLG